jgi:hypothetical protein
MFFIKEDNIKNFLSTMLNTPALKNLNETMKNALFDTLVDHNIDAYINQPQDIIHYMQYSSSEKYAELLFSQYGINKKYYNKLNKTFKKVLLYNLENIYQYKGTIKTLEFFSNIFRTVLGDMNFYRVIVVKKKSYKDVKNLLNNYEYKETKELGHRKLMIFLRRNK